MVRTVIGGEFDFDVNRLFGLRQNDFLKEGYLYASGRAALYNILLSIQNCLCKNKNLYLPNYLCHTIAQTAQKTAYTVKYYKLNSKLEIDKKSFENLYEKGSVVLLINFFGLQTLNAQIDYLKELDGEVCIIEDNVQSFYSMFEDSLADYSFTSFRKSFSVPDGGWVKTAKEMPKTEGVNTFAQYKAVGGILKSFRNYECFDDSIYLKLLEKGEDMIDENLTRNISQLTLSLFSGIDTDRVKILRQRNAAYIVNGLNQLGIKQILKFKEDKVPLFVPVWLEDRNKVKRSLFEKQIFCPVHWPVKTEITGHLEKGEEMAEHELSIIVDHRYGLQEMNLIFETLQSVIYEL